MRKCLLLILGFILITSSLFLHAHAAEQKPKFTLIFERGKEIPCSRDQGNISIDFTSAYTVYKPLNHDIEFDLECRFSFSYDKKDFPDAKNIFYIKPEIFENNAWLSWDKAYLAIPELRNTVISHSGKKSSNDNKQRLDATVFFPYIEPLRSDGLKATSYLSGAKPGVFCLDQNPGPIKIRYRLMKNEVSYFSNVVSLSYVNYDKILYDGKNCYSTSKIVVPQTTNNTQSSQPVKSSSKAGATALTSCTTNTKLILIQLDRQYLAASLNYSDKQKKARKLDQDYQYANVLGNAGQMNQIQIEFKRIQSDLITIEKSMNYLSSERKKISAKCDPKSQPSTAAVPKLKQCTQIEISLIQSFANQHATLMRRFNLAYSEIALQQERIGGLLWLGRMEEIARANFIIEEQTQYANEVGAQAAYIKKQFDTANSSCLNSGVSVL